MCLSGKVVVVGGSTGASDAATRKYALIPIGAKWHLQEPEISCRSIGSLRKKSNVAENFISVRYVF